MYVRIFKSKPLSTWLLGHGFFSLVALVSNSEYLVFIILVVSVRSVFGAFLAFRAEILPVFALFVKLVAILPLSAYRTLLFHAIFSLLSASNPTFSGNSTAISSRNTVGANSEHVLAFNNCTVRRKQLSTRNFRPGHKIVDTT